MRSSGWSGASASSSSALAAYVLIALALVCWLRSWRARARWPKAPAFFVPLLALAAWTLVSSAFSADRGESFFRDRQLLYYLIVPLTLRVARGPRAMTALNVVIAVGAASALVGIVQYLAWGADENHRPHGVLGHYMTYSGVLMLVFAAAIGRLVYRGAEWIWPAVAVPALLVALVVTESRNAWVGALLAVICLLSLRQWKLLVAVPAFLVVFVLFAPGAFRARAFSTFDSTNTTNRDRISMLKSGVSYDPGPSAGRCRPEHGAPRVSGEIQTARRARSGRQAGLVTLAPAQRACPARG